MLAKTVRAGLALVALGFSHVLSDSLQQCQGLQSRKPRCDFGLLPGRWWNGEGRSGWRTFDPGCQLKEFVGKPTSSSTVSGAPQQAVSVLFFGDSVARTIVADVCSGDLLWDTPDLLYSMSVESFCLCRHQDFTVARQALIGIHPAGPWPKGEEGTPSERIAHGFARFKEELGRLPDIVVLSSAFWDLARWVEHYPSLVAADSLGHLMLAAWAQQLSDVMQMVEEQAPNALYISYTSAPPEKRNCLDGTGLLRQEVLGKSGHLIELNSALRETVRRRDWNLIDLERMVAKFPSPSAYLRDHHHPNREVLSTVLNIILNIYSSACNEESL